MKKCGLKNFHPHKTPKWDHGFMDHGVLLNIPRKACHCRSCTTLKGTYATVFSGHCHTTGQSVAIKRTATNSWGIVVKKRKHIDGNILKCIAEFAAYKYSPSWNPNAIRLKTCDGSQVEITIHSCRQTELECVSEIFRTQQLERDIMRPPILEPPRFWEPSKDMCGLKGFEKMALGAHTRLKRACLPLRCGRCRYFETRFFWYH